MPEISMKKSIIFFNAIVIISICSLSTLSFSSEEKIRTGIVRYISKDRVELDSLVGYLSIGFTCEPEVCASIKNISIRDEVLMIFGAVNKINKLLSIRECKQQDKDCLKAREKENASKI